jgi:hypothetical protein
MCSAATLSVADRWDGVEQVPGMAGPERLHREAADMLPMTQVNGTSERMTRLYDA